MLYNSAADKKLYSRKAAENTVKHSGGGVGLVITKHCASGGNSVTATT